jgi:hypothetical protein
MGNKSGNVFLSCIERKYWTNGVIFSLQEKHIEVFTFFKNFQGLLSSYKRLWYGAYDVSILFNLLLGY